MSRGRPMGSTSPSDYQFLSGMRASSRSFRQNDALRHFAAGHRLHIKQVGFVNEVPYRLFVNEDVEIGNPDIATPDIALL